MTESCPICGSATFDHPGKMSLPGIGDRLLRRCARCGLMSASPLPESGELAAVYGSPDYFRTGDLSHGYMDYLKYNAAEREAEGGRFAAELVRLSGPRGKLLEIGCATGHFLYGLGRACAWEAVGMDVSGYAVRFAREDLGLQVVEGRVEDAAWDSGSFDVVYLHDVLEHVLEPMAFLREIRRILKPSGRLYLFVPDGALDAKPFLNMKGAAAVSPHWHLHFFPTAAVKAALRIAGFSKIKTSRSGFAQGLVDVGILKSPRVWASLSAPSRALNRLLFRALSSWPLADRICGSFLGHELKIVAS